jgi:TolB-like protein
MLRRQYGIRSGLLLSGLFFLSLVLCQGQGWAMTYDFDEGIEVLTQGLLSVRKQALKGEKIAVFGMVESKTNKRWEISSDIEDGIVDVLVNEGYTVIERRRINDIIKKELNRSADFWFDEAQVTQVGKLVGADVVITGRYVRWGGAALRISVRAISVSDGKVMAANKVKIHTDRIAELLKPVVESRDEKTPEMAPVRKETTIAPKTPQQPGATPPVNQPTTTLPPAPPQMGGFCCDQYGNRRCTLVQPVPLGSPCFCPGQGYGYTCQ